MRIVGKEDRKRSSGNGQPRFRGIAEEPDVALVVERAVRLSAVGERPPADLFVTFDRELDVDMTPVRLEARTGAPASVDAIDQGEHAVAVDWMPDAVELGGDGAQGELDPVGVREELESLRELGMQRGVAAAIAQRVEDHEPDGNQNCRWNTIA